MIIPELPANLRQPCEKLNTLDAGDGRTIARWFVVNVPKHNSCARNHDAVIKAYDDIKKLADSINQEKP